MKWSFSDPQLRRRLLFVAGNLAVLAAMIGFGLAPIVEALADRDARIEQQSKHLARLTAIARDRVRVESILAQAKTQLQSGEFLTGPNENNVSADLQTKLKALTQGAGASPRAVQALPAKTLDQTKYSGVRIEMTGPLQAILRAVYAIETSKPYLFVFAAGLKTAPPVRPGIPDEPMVQAQLDVFGALLAGGQP